MNTRQDTKRKITTLFQRQNRHIVTLRRQLAAAQAEIEQANAVITELTKKLNLQTYRAEQWQRQAESKEIAY